MVITNPGSGYTSAPTLTFSGGGGTVTASSATLQACASGVATASVTTASGYASAPSVTFSAPTGPGGITATGTVTFNSPTSLTVVITNPGSGYTSAPTLTFTGGGGTVSASSTTLQGFLVGNLVSIGTTTGQVTFSGSNYLFNNGAAIGINVTAASTLVVNNTTTFNTSV